MKRKLLFGGMPAVLLAFIVLGCASTETLAIKEQGAFSAGGTVISTEGNFDPHIPFFQPQGGQTRHGDHADVFYQIPVNAKPYSMVFLHGAGQSRRTWQTTSDGREGFQNIFLKKGYSVYLVDQPRRGDAGQSTVSAVIDATPDDQVWFTQFRIGPWPDFYEGVQFPRDEKSLDQFFRQMTPNTGDFDEELISDGIAAVFDKAGPGILFTHSQGGGPGWQTAIKNEKVKAVVALEPAGFPLPQEENSENPQSISMDDFVKLTKIPIIIYFGDNIPANETDIFAQNFWRMVLNAAKEWAETVNRYGGDVTVVYLPEIGITGNTHFIMSDLNNQVVAEHIAHWLNEKGLK
ncbi:alpha/beta hydrolase [Spirochaetia bacterium]|nr:alpha/beta hydrolase [Spirochaetia bacterium]GHU31596.1 alpha/beta hydrolase [Spirochaetia bacterium]